MALSRTAYFENSLHLDRAGFLWSSCLPALLRISLPRQNFHPRYEAVGVMMSGSIRLQRSLRDSLHLSLVSRPEQHMRLLLVVFLWFSSSSAAILLSKYIFTNVFPFPLTVTATNNVVAALMSYFTVHGQNWLHRKVVPFIAGCQQSTECVREHVAEENVSPNPQNVQDVDDIESERLYEIEVTRSSLVSRERAIKTTSNFFTYGPVGVVIGIATAAEIGMSNLALQKLSVTFSTLLKGSAPLSILLWSAVLGVQALRMTSLAASLVLLFGIALASSGQAYGVGTRQGVALQFGAAVVSGFRWTLTQIFLRGQDDHVSNKIYRSIGMDESPSALKSSSYELGGRQSSFHESNFEQGGKSNIGKRVPLNSSSSVTILATAPATMACIAPLSLFVEGSDMLSWFHSSTVENCCRALLLLVVIGILVFTLLWAEYELVSTIGAVAVGVLFVIKEVCLVYLKTGKLSDLYDWRHSLQQSRQVFPFFALLDVGSQSHRPSLFRSLKTDSWICLL